MAADPPRLAGTAIVRMDRCFKGDSRGVEVRVAVDNFYYPGGGPQFLPHSGDYLLFFLKPMNERYATVDQWFGALNISRATTDATGSPKLQLEMDLKAGLRDSDPERALDSIRMLGNMKTLSSTAELKSLLETQDLVTKTYVWQALLRLKDISVLPAVAEFFATQPELPNSLLLPRDRVFSMQSKLMMQVGAIRDPEALPFLESFAVSKEERLRMWALQALRSIGSMHSAAVFLKELDDPDADNGFSAMQGLLSLRPMGDPTDWVPTWAEFRRAPQLYSIKTHDWWQATYTSGSIAIGAGSN